MTSGMLVFASLISNINNVLNDGSLLKFEEKMEALDEFFKYRGLPEPLLERVRNYHEKIFEMSHGMSDDSDTVTPTCVQPLSSLHTHVAC